MRGGSGSTEFTGIEEGRRRQWRDVELKSEQSRGSWLGFLGVAEGGAHGRFIGTDVESKGAGNRR